MLSLLFDLFIAFPANIIAVVLAGIVVLVIFASVLYAGYFVYLSLVDVTRVGAVLAGILAGVYVAFVLVLAQQELAFYLLDGMRSLDY